jgi:hypothetical protein
MGEQVVACNSLILCDLCVLVSLPVPSAARSRGGTPRKPEAGTATLREEFTFPNVAEIIGKFGGSDHSATPSTNCNRCFMRPEERQLPFAPTQRFQFTRKSLALFAL